MSREREAEENLKKLSNPYPGRIVGVGLSPDGLFWRLFAGMGGRSASSNNRYYRLFEDMNGHGPYIRTELHDPSGARGDETATLYIAHRQRRGWHVVGNGEQVEGISINLAANNHIGDMVTLGFERGQSLYEHEGPRNGNTARITAASNNRYDSAMLGKILRHKTDYSKSTRITYHLISYDGFSLHPGHGFFTTTYDGAGGMEPNYERPYKISVPDTLEEWRDQIWEAWKYNKAGLVLEEANRISGAFRLVTKSIHPDREFSTDFELPSHR